MVTKAHAKINLSLDIIGKMPDGYHEVRMVMQTISLCDIAEVCESNVAERDRIHVVMKNSNIPADESNLCHKAARAFLDETDSCGKTTLMGLDITITKNIPEAAGLAGGSTDAAAVLYLANELLRTKDVDSALDTERLLALAKSVGADVPFCLLEGTGLCEGIGEKITRLSAIPDCSILIAKVKEGMSTATIYNEYDALDSPYHPDVDRQVQAVLSGDIREIAAYSGNTLFEVTNSHIPAVGELVDIIRKTKALGAQMSGSGPSVFGIFTSEKDAEDAADAVRERFPEAFTYVGCPCDSNREL